MRRLIPTMREIFTNGPFKIFVSVSLLTLDSNREARTSSVFKIGIECKLVIYVEACVLLKTNSELLKIIYSNKTLPDCPCL